MKSSKEYLKEKILSEIPKSNLSKIINEIIEFAILTNSSELKKLCNNEKYGYETIENLPDYRFISVELYDENSQKIGKHSGKFFRQMHEMFEFERIPFTCDISSLERYTYQSSVITFTVLSEPIDVTINENTYKGYSFKHDVKDFIKAINLIKKKITYLIENTIIEQDSSIEFLLFLHPKVLAIGRKLFENNHYRQCVLDVFIGLVQEVKRLSGSDLDGTQLMQKVFSKDNPILKLSDNKDEQLGYMWLFSGVIMAFRNSLAHSLKNEMNKKDCIEKLFLASNLFTVLDSIEKK